VVRRPSGPPPGTHSRLARSLARRVRDAREARLDDESIESLLRVTLQAAAGEEIALMTWTSSGTSTWHSPCRESSSIRMSHR
jgi:hypothetical protein